MQRRQVRTNRRSETLRGEEQIGMGGHSRISSAYRSVGEGRCRMVEWNVAYFGHEIVWNPGGFGQLCCDSTGEHTIESVPRI